MNTRPTLRRRGIVFLLSLFLTGAHLVPVLAGQKASNPSRSGDASSNGKFELTIDNIMRGTGLVGNEPRAVHWSPDSQKIYFQWKQANEPREKDFDTYVVNRDGSGLRKLSEDELKMTPPLFGETSRDKKQTLFVDNGDL